jgi:hypothetical protein
MNRRQFLASGLRSVGLVAVTSVLGACGAAATPASNSNTGSTSFSSSAAGSEWEKTWNDWQAAAKQEQTVVVFGPPTPKLRETLPAAVKTKLGLNLQYTGQAGGDFVSKLATERAAGTYSTDVVVAGAGSMFQGVANGGKIENGVMGMLAPLKPRLLLPEVLDASKYQDTKLWFVDPSAEYVLRIVNFTAATIAVNTNVLKLTDIKRWQDLLSPAYTGKIVSYDPTVAGAAIAPTTQLWKTFGQDFVKQLLVDQKPFISRDHRQSADLLGNGSRPVSLFLQQQALSSAAEQGLPVTALPALPDITATSFRRLRIFGAPRPRAASERGQGIHQLDAVARGPAAMAGRTAGNINPYRLEQRRLPRMV